MSLDKLPNELIALIAEYVGARELHSLILSARRFYFNSALMDRLYIEKVMENKRSFCVPSNLIHAAFLNQVAAFIGLFNAWLDDRKRKGESIGWDNCVYIPYISKPDTPFDRWKQELEKDFGFWGHNVSPLHLACHADSKEMIEFALSKDIDTSICHRGGYRPLHISAAGGKTVAIQSLIAAGAEIDDYASRKEPKFDRVLRTYNTCVVKRCTPFHLAVKRNKKTAAELLLDAGADHLAITVDGYDALTLAVHGRVSPELVHYLLGLGYSRNSLNTALIAASDYGAVLYGKAFLDAGARASFSCLVAALKCDHVSMIRLLVDHDADLLETDADGKSLLYFVRSEAASRILLEGNPCITTVGIYPDGPLSSLRDYGPKIEIDIVPLTAFLITNGSIVDHKTMLWAAKAGHLQVLEALKKRYRPFMHINHSRDNFDNTPLHLAMLAKSNYSVEWVDFLLEIGYDVNAVNKQGETPLLYAFSSESRGDIPREIDVSIRHLITEGLNILAQSYDGTTALHRALIYGHIWAAHLLLDAGADIHIADIQGETVLHAAARGGYLETIEKLIQTGVDMSITTKKRESVLHLAVRGAISSHSWDQRYTKMLACTVLSYEDASIEAQAKGEISSMTGHMELIRWLIRHEMVDPSITNNKGHTAFDLIKLHEPGIDWDRLESFDVATGGGCNEVTAQLVQWVTEEDLTSGIDGFDISLEAFEGLTIP